MPGVEETVGAEFFEVRLGKRVFRAPKWQILEASVAAEMATAGEKLKVLRLVEDAETVFAARMASYMAAAEQFPTSCMALPPPGAVTAALIDTLRWAKGL